MNRVRRELIGVLLLLQVAALAAHANCYESGSTDADVGIHLSMSQSRIDAPGVATVRDDNGNTCFGLRVTARITITQSSPALNYTEMGSSLGSYLSTLSGPARQGACYSSTMGASSMWGSDSSGAGPVCWPAITQPEPVRDPESPIILSLGGGGYRLTSAAAGVQFDIRNDGRPVQIAWTEAGSANAFLALDRNRNGAIDSGAELFGNHTPLQSGAVAGNGFAALADLDRNGDGLLDELDAAWSSLLLWTDGNHDGRSAPGELQPVAGSGITALETGTRWIGRTDEWGNEFRYMAHYQLAQARRAYYDVFLQTQ